MKLINGTIWEIYQNYLDIIESLEINEEKINEAARRATSFRNVKGNIAVIPIQGAIFNRDNIYSRIFGASNEGIGAMFDAAIADPSIGAVVFDIDSPGGTIEGTQELNNKIYNARGTKPIITAVNGWMASAAYHIGSAADEIIASPSSQIGSIGVLMVHAENSKQLEAEGIKYTIIKAGEYKIEANSVEPLSDDAKVYLQSQVDTLYEDFVSHVARNRGTNAGDVKSNYGKGRMLLPQNALKSGMIDRIGTFDQIISNLVGNDNKGKKNQSRNLRAKVDIRKAAAFNG